MNTWWGYLHVNGSLQVKRFFDHRDIQEANESPFVQRAVGPFKAKGREDAFYKLREVFNGKTQGKQEDSQSGPAEENRH